MRNLDNLDRLEQFLKDQNIPYERYDNEEQDDVNGFCIVLERHQICVPCQGNDQKWDAICQYGSYGADEGLLEIYGTLVDIDSDGDSVVGYLTAEDVIERIKERGMPLPEPPKEET